MTVQTLSVGLHPTIEIGQVGGDLTVQGWERPELEVNSDDLNQVEQAGESISLSSGGDLNLSVPRASRMTLSFVGGDLRLEGLDGALEISFVGGDATLRNLTGEVSLSGLVGGETNMENVGRISMDAGRGSRGPEAAERFRRKVEQKMHRAELKAEIKMRNAERKARHAMHRVDANLGVERWKWNVTPGSFPPGGMGDPVTDEERMAILKMLQEKKITSEEADKLLAALEGGE